MALRDTSYDVLYVRSWELSRHVANIVERTLLTDAVEKGFDSIVASLDAAFDGRGGGLRR
jgi:hypothetical protein